MSEMSATVIVGLLALLSGASITALINSVARRRVTSAEADLLVVDAADKLMIRQQDQLNRGDQERIKMEVEIASLRAEVAQLRSDIHNERDKCAIELAALRSEILALASRVNPDDH